jgi:hypothetical protein
LADQRRRVPAEQIRRGTVGVRDSILGISGENAVAQEIEKIPLTVDLSRRRCVAVLRRPA